MLNNLTTEIFYYSVIPAAVIAFIVLILLFIGKKNENVFYKYNYAIKISLLLIISLVLPLIIGYTIWVVERFIKQGALSSNIFYILLLVVLIAALIFLIVIICNKLTKGIDNSNKILSEYEKEF